MLHTVRSRLHPVIGFRMAFTAKLIGLKFDTFCIQPGMKPRETSAVLMNRRGKVTAPAIPKTVSALFVFSPSARDIPDQARPKKATVKITSKEPMIPVAG